MSAAVLMKVRFSYAPRSPECRSPGPAREQHARGRPAGPRIEIGPGDRPICCFRLIIGDDCSRASRSIRRMDFSVSRQAPSYSAARRHQGAFFNRRAYMAHRFIEGQPLSRLASASHSRRDFSIESFLVSHRTIEGLFGNHIIRPDSAAELASQLVVGGAPDGLLA